MTIHVKVVADEIYRRFVDTPRAKGWEGTPVDSVADGPLEVGGRTRLTLFDGRGEQRQPRMLLEALPVVDPLPRDRLLSLPEQLPASARGLRDLVARILTRGAAELDAKELTPGDQEDPLPGERDRRNRVAARRKQVVFEQARELLARCQRSGAWRGDEVQRAARELTDLEWEAHCGEVLFEDQDMGTHYAYTGDEPFVHYLEALLGSLPSRGGEAMALLPLQQRASVERQRDQLVHHQDHLMRRRYAHTSVVEADIERSVGALLVQRGTHLVVSHERLAAGEGKVPGFELLRVDPLGGHARAGAWIYRSGGDICLQDGSVITVEPEQVLATPLEPDQLTFLRAPGDPRLRPGMHFDWDNNGFITDEPLPWIRWAGFCDLQSTMEMLGLTFDDAAASPEVTEYRSDTGETVTYSRKLLREMAASVLELGSDYLRMDTGERVRLSDRKEGGIRVRDRRDRLDLYQEDGRQIIRWPLEGMREDFEVVGAEGPDGEALDPVALFHRHLPDKDRLEMPPNPRFQHRAGGNIHSIDPVGLLLRMKIRVDTFDPETGYFRRDREETVVDLREQPQQTRFFLGTRLWSSARREVFRYYLDRAEECVVAELDRYERSRGRWQPRALKEHTRRTRLQRPLRCSLLREVMRDDPLFFAPLLDLALRRGEGIVADTDMGGEVWNGVVTLIHARRLGADPDTRVERWQVYLKARHGESTMDFLLRRDAEGVVEEACPTPGPDGWGDYPDFLWQHHPDIKPVVRHQGQWLVNMSMVGRGIITADTSTSPPAVQHDHLSRVHELLYCALSGTGLTIVHQNRRYGFRDRESWQRAVDRLTALRARIRFEGDPRDPPRADKKRNTPDAPGSE